MSRYENNVSILPSKGIEVHEDVQIATTSRTARAVDHAQNSVGQSGWEILLAIVIAAVSRYLGIRTGFNRSGK